MSQTTGQSAMIQPGAGGRQTDTTVIAKEMTLSGDFVGAGTILIEGTVIGGIKLDGAVTVAGTGVVKGPIKADTVSVAGCVEGDIVARTSLRLEMTGSITGDVTIRSFIIEDGGYFNGRSRMTSGAEPVIVY